MHGFVGRIAKVGQLVERCRCLSAAVAAAAAAVAAVAFVVAIAAIAAAVVVVGQKQLPRLVFAAQVSE